MKNLNFLISGFYFVLIFCVFFIFGFYTYYKYKFSTHPSINNKLYEIYPKDIILKTGGALKYPEDRLQHFKNFSMEKDKGTIRIGAFGDSHTFGAEVEKTATYPYYLQKLFSVHFPNHSIEVLNFGISGTGFQEQFFLWEKYAKTYQLNYILLGPVGFYTNRDTSFTDPFPEELIKFQKNRYILTEDHQPKEVHIKGNTVQERFRNYYSLIPSWTALRYDKQPFKVYEILFPFLRGKIKNPFYYTKTSEEEETVQINTQLLEKINKIYPKKILFLTSHKDTYNSYKLGIENSLSDNYLSPINLYNLNFIPILQFMEEDFYRVFLHASSLGNELIAQVYFNALLGKTHFFVNTIHCHFKDSKQTSHTKNIKINLDAIDSIEIIGGGNLLFNLKANRRDHFWKNGTYKNHKKAGTKSFLTFLNTDNFLKSVYIPLSFQLKEGMKIYIQSESNKRIELGAIQALDNYNKFFALYYGEQGLDHYYFIIYFKDLKIEKKAELFIDNHKLGQIISKKGNLLKFIPEIGYLNTFLTMGPQGSVREADFPKKFPVYIKYETANGKNFKSLILNLTCRKEKQEVNLDLSHFEPLKL